MSVLPQGWADAEIGQIAQIETGNTPSKNDGSLYGREVCFYKPGDLDVGGVVSVSNDMVSKAGAQAGRLLPAESLLVTCIGNLGKSALIAQPAICNQQINAVLPSSVVEPHYLYYWSRTLKPWLEENSSATTVSIINKGRFSKAPIRIAPLLEQRRIVAKIDSLTGKSRRARDHLDHIPRLVEKYRQAVLVSAFSERDRTAWGNGKLEDFISDALIGLVRGKSEQSDISGAPYIRMNHFDLNGQWNDDKLTFIEATPQEIGRYELCGGDVLFNTRNSFELVGKVALWQDGRAGHLYNNNILRLRFNEKVVPRFATLWMMSEPFRAYLQTQKSATTSVCAIYQRSIMAAPFPLPSIAEQNAIVAKIDSAFTWIDRLAADATSARTLIGHLDQAVLAKAFKGELVPQDPNDEPASALLDRIGAERAAAPTAKRGRKKAA
ncbi:MAG: restriction endonuclease subunit S [Pseudomonadota bacterium]